MIDETNDRSTRQKRWAPRFGWLVGGILGLVGGILLTYVIEVTVLVRRVRNPTHVASYLSSVIVGGLFLAGALAGHALGSRGGPSRYKSLGIALGVLIATSSWAFLVLTR